MSMRAQIATALAVAITLATLSSSTAWMRDSPAAASGGGNLLAVVRQQAAEITRLKQELAAAAQTAHEKRESGRESGREAFAKQQAELEGLQQELLSLREAAAAHQSAAQSAAVTPAPAAAPAESPFAGSFLLASRTALAPRGDATHARQLLKSLLSMAALLNRTLVLPAALCSCADAASPECAAQDGSDAAFECPLHVPLGTGAWAQLAMRVPTQPPRFMAALPEELRCSHVKVEMLPGLDAEELMHALRGYASTRVLEIEGALGAYCGPHPREGPQAPGPVAAATADAMLTAAMQGGAASYAPCSHSLKEQEVNQYTDMGKCLQHTVTADLARFPPSVRELPRNTDLMVTFATGSVATMAHNWVAALHKAGVKDVLIGAIDDAMMQVCTERNLPCVLIEGGEINKQLAARSAQNVRADAKLYPKMSVLKVGFYRELLSHGFNVWACDADAIFMNDPRPLMRETPWTQADLAIATDCIDLPGDARSPLLHCDFNTGIVYLRSNAATLAFADNWREKVANAKEARIRDQAAFNMITKAKGLEQFAPNGTKVPRIYLAGSGSADGSRLKLGVLPLNRFLNGHTFFVQHAHTLPGALPPLSVHMTYQFAEGSSFAYGKRQRLREAGYWFVDEPAYYSGRFLSVSLKGANLKPRSLPPSVDSRDAVAHHLREHAHRVAVLRALLGIGKLLGRTVILPRMLCYCDFLWKEMRACRVGGAESMRLPFECPMDHVLDTPRWFENELGVEVRQPSFLSNANTPKALAANAVKVTLPQGLPEQKLRAALAPYADAPLIELEEAAGRFCGFDDAAANDFFLRQSEHMLSYKRVPFCMMEGTDAPLYSQCCTPRKEGEPFFPCIHGFEPPAPLPSCTH